MCILKAGRERLLRMETMSVSNVKISRADFSWQLEEKLRGRPTWEGDVRKERTFRRAADENFLPKPAKEVEGEEKGVRGLPSVLMTVFGLLPML